jgi:Phage tail protein (Tail_P2_I)
MKSPYEAWTVDQRPLFSRLPGVQGQYSRNSVVDSITKFWDEFLVFQKSQVDLLFTQNLNPLTCDSEYLDYLAYMSGFNDRYWERSYPDSAKRKLIDGAFKVIWRRFGTFQSLGYVIDCFDIKNRIQKTGDYTVGESLVGDVIGDLGFNYTIFLPTIYQGQAESRRVEQLNFLYGIGYADYSIIYDDSKFVEVDLLLTDDDRLVTTDDNTTIAL